MKKISLVIAGLIMAFAVNAQTTKWDFDKSHSKVTFTVAHMMITDVMGSFGKYSGSVLSDKEDFSDAKVTFNIEVSSINTDDSGRDKHLQSPDFFNVEKFPEIAFVSKSMKNVGKGMYKMTGDFTMMGVTKSIVLDVKYAGTVKDPYGNIKAGFKISGTIDRTLWGLKYNSAMDAGGLMIGNDVAILSYVELKKI